MENQDDLSRLQEANEILMEALIKAIDAECVDIGDFMHLQEELALDLAKATHLIR